MWQACAHVIGRADLAALGTAARLADPDRVEQALAAWTATQVADRAMAALQEAGVAAGVARAPFALFEDPQLLARGYWRTYPRPYIGDFPQSVLPFREDAEPYPIECPAPTLGQHTDAVLTTLLGYAPQQIAQLAQAGGDGHGNRAVSAHAEMTAPLLSVEQLGISIGGLALTQDISFAIAPGERVGMVGESGCGKTITGLSLLGLLPPGAKLAGQVMFEGADLLQLSQAALRTVRGRRIGMIFQEPMSALDPVFTVGEQIAETARRHMGLGRKAARGAGHRDAGGGGDPAASAALRRVSAPVVGRDAPARDDCRGTGMRSGAADRRRTDDSTGRDGAGADHRPAARSVGPDRHCTSADYA